MRLFALPARASVAQRSPVTASRRIAPDEIHAAITALAGSIVHRHPKTPPILIGIANGGIPLARRLATQIPGAPCGTIDISFHRDDIGRNPITKELATTEIPVDVTGATVVLVDDVLFSGRTAKAAMDELFDHGRPTRVELAVLVDRGGHRMPIAADYCGLALTATETERVVVHLDPADPKADSIRILPARPAAPAAR